MRYLLDVSSLVALGLQRHVFHKRVAHWVLELARAGAPELATCSITELGFVRVLSQASEYGYSVKQARELLLLLKNNKTVRCAFIPDDRDISHLPRWVTSPKHTTDGHLVDLADASGARLATLDERIAGAFLIPREA